jgi:hypothetical protein
MFLVANNRILGKHPPSILDRPGMIVLLTAVCVKPASFATLELTAFVANSTKGAFDPVVAP